jgi:hypothetical protein
MRIFAVLFPALTMAILAMVSSGQSASAAYLAGGAAKREAVTNSGVRKA